ncbi:MAG TPA: MBL fold metallo-hydrolase [Saprospiraceae bacterium]|nr:MBL fold metallo-hydrolase [Saprospiraceae bacterium]
MQIKFCGAANTVTGSCHLITLSDGFRILLDCGMFQGAAGDLDELNSNWHFDPSSIDVMILSHAHIDHCGRIPKLVKDRFNGLIYATHATRDLAGIMLMDTAHILEKDAQYHNEKVIEKLKKKGVKASDLKKVEPIYSAKDVAVAMQQFVSCSYDTSMKIADGVELVFKDAGHILGSASVNLKIDRAGEQIRLGFTGDIGRPNRPILRDPIPMLQADVIISESTYGNRLHDEKPAEKNKFLEIIKKTCVEQRGKLVIPAFSVGRTQEIVHLLDQLTNENRLPKIPVYVDSPLSVNATSIFKSHPECFDFELHQYLLRDPNPFGFNLLHYVTEVAESKKLNSSNDPCIIISSAGMINAGRIKHHVANSIENPNNTILMVGYCSPETPGGILRSGATEIKLFGELLQVNASVELMDSFSAHGDQHEMTQFLENQKSSCEKLFLVHGEIQTQEAYKDHLLNEGFKSVHAPAMKEEVIIH